VGAIITLLMVGIALMVGIGSSPASACSITESFRIELSDLRDADPAEPLAHLRSSYDEWRSELQPWQRGITRSTPPDLIGVWYEHSVVVVSTLSEHQASDGGLVVVESEWGTVPDLEPVRPWLIDHTSCQDLFPFPRPGAFYAETNGGRLAIEQPEDDAQRREAVGVLTGLFGEPTREPASIGEQRAALDEVVAKAEEWGLAPVDVRVLDPASRAVLADGSFPWVVVVLGLGAMGVGALLAFRPIRVRGR